MSQTRITKFIRVFNVIEENGLPEDQMTLFKSDIHYSHKDAEVIKLLKENNIIPFFTPAKLTDVF